MRDSNKQSARLTVAGLMLVGLLVPAGCGRKPAESVKPAAKPTFAKDVAPIVFKNCSYCHRPDQTAPFELLTYKDVSKRARQIGEVATSRYMPPWLPEPGYNQFQHERVLTAAEIATITNWVAAGAPEGNPADLPPTPEFPSKWQLGPPDLIVKLPEPYTLKADGPDVYRNFVIPIPTERKRFVKSMEFRPGNPRVVHHAFLAIDTTDGSHQLDLKDKEAGYPGMHLPHTTTMTGGQFFSWQPGKLPMGGDPRRAWELDTNSWLVIQAHMQTTGKPEKLQPEVGIYFTDKPGTDITYKLGLSSYDLNIPAGATNFEADDVFELPVDVELLGILPHAHYLARRMLGVATLPDGSNRWLLNIQKWDFNWQGEYWYQQPIKLPRGTRVGMRFFYDNSTNNLANPTTPPQPVTYGLYTTNEMAELWMIFRLKSEQDWAVMNRAVVPKVATEVVKYSQILLRRDPSDAGSWLQMGTGYYALGQSKKAVESLRRALQFDPTLDEAHYYLGLVAYDAHDFAHAEAALKAAVAINPRNYKAHGYLGLVYLNTGDYAKSEASLREALRINPDDTVAQRNLQLLQRVREANLKGPAAPGS